MQSHQASGEVIRNVTVAGVTGALGTTLIHALCDAGFQVRALTRSDKAPKPELGDATVRHVDYTDREELESVLRGQDAVISVLGDTAGAVAAQHALIKASIAVGVKRFVPSEYGSDTLNARVHSFPFFADKLAHQELLKRAADEHPTFSYSILITGAFLDWGLSVVPFIVNMGSQQAQRFDGGDVPFSATRVPTIATALVNLLEQPEATKNRVLYIHDTITTQNRLLACAERLDSRLKFSKASIDMQALEGEAWKLYRDPSADPMLWIFSFINVSMFSREELCTFRTNDNRLLGVEELYGPELNEALELEVAKAISIFGDHNAAGCVLAAERAIENGRSKLREEVNVC